MAPSPAFTRIVVLGTGLIGGSFALALRQASPKTIVVGWDKLEVLERALSRGAIQEAQPELAAAVRGADLVYLALPIVRAIEVLSEIVRHTEASALVTDACSTKVAIARAAATHFRSPLRFLGGHPMTGKESSGIENADAELFRGAKYVLAAQEEDSDPRVSRFVALVRSLGGEPVWCDAETHDWAVAIVSHLPQLVATALAGVVLKETDETGMPLELVGPALRDVTRLAGSPYDVWRDICLTNTQNIARALDRVIQALERMRTHLASKELQEEFLAANELYKILRGLQ